MRKEDLSAADKALLQTDFGELDKVAAEQVKVASEMYEAGVEMAQTTADQMDKLAEDEEEEKKEEKKEEHDEGEKKAAIDYGNIIAEGFLDKLAALGVERHGNEAHYLVPFVEEKVAAVGARAALEKFAAPKASFLANLGAKAKDAGKAVSGVASKAGKNLKSAVTGTTAKGKDMSAMQRLGAFHRGGGTLAAAGGAGFAAGRMTGGKKEG